MNHIRNFAIIAHVDHGKSTLADRMLELTHTVSARQMHNQLLDSNPIERERGITIKLAPVRMQYVFEGQNYLLNLIDTPGHVDFSYEVNRSLAACEGALLLVDATQGVQAQTLAHYHEAQKLGLPVIPVVNKIDITTAEVAVAAQQIQDIFGFSAEEILYVSGKTGQGVAELLGEIIRRIPAPRGNPDGALRALVFNSNFDPHLGVVAWVRVVDGKVTSRDQLLLLGTDAHTAALEVGTFIPQKSPGSCLSAGEVGYVVTGLHDISDLTVGDTLTVSSQVAPLPGYQPVKPVVFVSFYPTDGAEINVLRDALGKLRLQDSSLQYVPEFSPALGNGFRVGLLGMLHADIVQERLEREFGLNLIAAAPSVGYQILTASGQLITISKAMDMPDASLVKEIREPVIKLSVFVPETFVGPVIQLCQEHRGTLDNMEYLGRLVHLTYSLPLAELIRGFYDQLKSVSQGFATLDYELSGFVAADLARLDILIAGEKVDALSQIVPRVNAIYIARDLVERLKNIIPRQQFEIAIQASIGAHVLARSDVKAFRKDVLAKMSGGDQTRKDKLLKKQKAGKQRMKRVGRIDIPQEAFLSILKVD
jgi:GTP-binding protein LepA